MALYKQAEPQEVCRISMDTSLIPEKSPHLRDRVDVKRMTDYYKGITPIKLEPEKQKL